MKIAIMGAGGLGGFFGGKLAQAGHDVWFIARGQQLAALKTSGLRLQGPDPEIVISHPNATEMPAEIGAVDLVLFCVKLYDVEPAAALIKPILTDATAVISVLNGIDGPQRLATALETGTVFSGAARISAKIKAPGVISYLGSGDRHKLTFGHPSRNDHPILVPFIKACRGAGFAAELAADIDEMLWDKLAQLAQVAALTTLGRIPMEVAMQDPLLFDIGKRVLQEIAAVARAKNVAINPNLVQAKLDIAANYPPNLYASMYHDLAAGKKIEVEGIFGYVAKTGQRLGIPTPTIDLVYAFLRPHASGGTLAT
ncbi:MAG TPA: 2-dehydropantoate 2-reductase [Rhodobacteraceae bacterium]|jgi:2-dehydropantoate 2-reductase|nr:2-dehydropantoate 2-reductase [Paracoccaceae bacterium]HBR62559.1 2-dehydropantoate 2-reductase [Paracoccaceae bacterium]|tara:strand:- start:1359 stop:2294 length:936 start_codon:yes stop_codon:yes gene_type:complete